MLERFVRLFNFARASLRKHGVRVVFARLCFRAYRRIVPIRAPVHPFDSEHGVDTGGLLQRHKIASGHAHDVHTTAYYGTHPSLLRAVLLQWKESSGDAAPPLGDYTFVDIGSGKGRVLLLASEFPFCRIVGVELSPALVRIARENVAKWQTMPRACREVSVLQCDVLDFELPAGPVLLFLYHPFGEALLGLWLAQLAAATRTRTTPIDLIYSNPALEHAIESLPEAHLLWTGIIPYSAEEAAADAFGSTGQRCSVYRLQRPALQAL